MFSSLKSALRHAFTLLTFCACALALPTIAMAEEETVTIGVNQGPHQIIMENVATIAARQGLRIKLKVYDDFESPNAALNAGEIWANCYQHEPYLKESLAHHKDYKLAKAFPTILCPLNIYSNKIKPGQDIPAGAKIGIPADPSNRARVLMLLAANKLITVKDPKDTKMNLASIVDNPSNFSFIELPAEDLPYNIDTFTCVAMNATFASYIHLDPVTDSVLDESIESPYVNIVVVRQDTLDDPRLAILKEAYQSAENAAFIRKHFPNTIYIGWPQKK